MDEAEFEKLLYSHISEKGVEAIKLAGNKFRFRMIFHTLRIGNFRLAWYYAWTMIHPLEGGFTSSAVRYASGWMVIELLFNLYQVFF